MARRKKYYYSQAQKDRANKKIMAKYNAKKNRRSIQRRARALIYQNKLQGMLNRISVANHFSHRIDCCPRKSRR